MIVEFLMFSHNTNPLTKSLTSTIDLTVSRLPTFNGTSSFTTLLQISDTTLNPGGVRLGTAEIYSVVEKFKEIKESIVIGQSWKNDIRIILFIVLNNGYELNDEIRNKIKKALKSDASPRHVPSKIIPILEIPKTKNGKLVELAVKQTIEGEIIKNLEALANPDSLKQFKNIKELNE